MGRGPSLKTELKKLRKKLETEFKTKLKLYSKHPQVWIGDRIADMAKQTGMKDITKIIAIVGVTVMVKRVIDTSEEIRGEIDRMLRPQGAFENINYFFSGWAMIQSWMYQLLQQTPISPELTGKKFEGMFPDWFDWVIAFAIAYIIVEHFGAIMQGVGNAFASIKGLVSGLVLGGGVGV